MSEGGIIAVFAKPPRAGQVKTRLAATLGAERAAQLARAFLTDTLATAQSVHGARVILASTEDDRGALALPEAIPLWLQGEGDLGARQERILARGLAQGARWVLAIGADSPGMPAALLNEAAAALAHAQAVLAPAEDGGYVLLGLRTCPRGLLANLRWSAPDTAALTRARLIEAGLDPVVLRTWFDVDEPQDLARLRALFARGEIHAPATQAALAAGDT